MNDGGSAWDDVKIEKTMGKLLRAGVILAAAVVFAGGVFYLLEYGKTVPDDRVFHGEPPKLRSVAGVVRDALAKDSAGIIQLGILLLIATPIARVVFSVFAFARERDYLYVGLTLFVLAILIYSLTGGHF